MEKKKLRDSIKKFLVPLLLIPTYAFSNNNPLDENVNEVGYFLSFSIPEKQIAVLIAAAELNGLPVYFRGLINNDMEATARHIQYMVSKYNISGVQIDPVRFEKYGINKVPALVKKCGDNFDVVYGNVAIKDALELIKKQGSCAK